MFQGQGALFLFYGVLVHHLLKNFFLDDFGLKAAGTITYLSMGVGTFLVLVSFVTNFVIMFPSTRNYGLLAIVFGCTLLFTIMFCIIGFFYTPNVNGALRVGFRQIMKNYNARSQINIYINGIHTQLKCCGSDDYTSWFQTTWAAGQIQVPESCCKRLKQCHNLEPLVISDIYEKVLTYTSSSYL
ncbi:uncharacterized protein CDAR_454101 [Caerostris darwini]|uniref:Tetraspanin n=1 Tax=Caerostris darwini TaxID=1538125 RepID=A0AAV4V7H4_9ARAC|nr:uncharacterized protein CDAR_454101 [Caerostris darwini]